MIVKFEKEDVRGILKKYVEGIIPGVKVTEVKSEYDGYACTTEATPQKKEPAMGAGPTTGGAGGTGE